MKDVQRMSEQNDAAPTGTFVVCGFCGFESYREISSDAECRRCRNQFASTALSGLLSNTLMLEHAKVMGIDGDSFPAWVAARSYAFADAMLQARLQGAPAGEPAAGKSE